MEPVRTVYNYDNPRVFLLDTLTQLQQDDSSMSVRKWSKQMGLKNHSLLGMILSGKRKLRIQHCSFLNNALGLNANELLYLKTLIQYVSADSNVEQELISGVLSDLHPGDGFSSKKLDSFKVVSGWVYMAILAMTDLKDFKGTEEDIASRLRNKVPLSEIRSALTRLLDLELLEWNKAGKLVPTCRKLETSDDVKDEGAQSYFAQVTDLAKVAIKEQHVLEREFQGFALCVPHEKIPRAKEMIRKFRSQFSKAISASNGDHVYQMNIQFFQLSKSPASTEAEAAMVATDAKNQKEKQNETI